ncbi:Type IV pilus (ATPase) [Escherichia coli]|nr:Type IV pilus (ATPase) [Escherichia coli]
MLSKAHSLIPGASGCTSFRAVSETGRSVWCTLLPLPLCGRLYAVLRLIKDDSQQIPTFSMLGYHPDQERTLRRILQRPEGIITLSGPTGSGKSTTLRTPLRRTLNSTASTTPAVFFFPVAGCSPSNPRRKGVFPVPFRPPSWIPRRAGWTPSNRHCVLTPTGS